MKHPKRLILSISLITTVFSWPSIAGGQVKNRETSTTSSACSRENALDTIRQQIDASRTFDDAVQRIAVLLRAADLLWPFQQENARAAFTEAFDLAIVNFKEKGDKPRQEGVGLVAPTPDHRST